MCSRRFHIPAEPTPTGATPIARLATTIATARKTQLREVRRTVTSSAARDGAATLEAPATTLFRSTVGTAGKSDVSLNGTNYSKIRVRTRTPERILYA